MKQYLNYFVEFDDIDKKHHFAIHQYRHSDGLVWSLRDHKFDWYDYSKNAKQSKKI